MRPCDLSHGRKYCKVFYAYIGYELLRRSRCSRTRGTAIWIALLLVIGCKSVHLIKPDAEPTDIYIFVALPSCPWTALLANIISTLLLIMITPRLTPALPPPPGQTSHFADPVSILKWGILRTAVCLSITTTVFLLRAWARTIISKQWILEDCKFFSLQL